MAVAFCGHREHPVGVLDVKAGAAQPQGRAQVGATHEHPRALDLGHIPGCGAAGLAKPALRFALLRLGSRHPQHDGVVHLLGGVGHRLLVALGGQVQGGVHPGQIGQRLVPHVLAGLGLPVADGVVAGGGGRALKGEHLMQDGGKQALQPGPVFLKSLAPVALQHLAGHVALPPGRVGGEPRPLQLVRRGVVPLVESVAVAGDGLGLQRLVRPGDGHLAGRRPDEVFQQRHLQHLLAARVPQADDLAVGGAARRLLLLLPGGGGRKELGGGAPALFAAGLFGGGGALAAVGQHRHQKAHQRQAVGEQGEQSDGKQRAFHNVLLFCRPCNLRAKRVI